MPIRTTITSQRNLTQYYVVIFGLTVNLDQEWLSVTWTLKLLSWNLVGDWYQNKFSHKPNKQSLIKSQTPDPNSYGELYIVILTSPHVRSCFLPFPLRCNPYRLSRVVPHCLCTVLVLPVIIRIIELVGYYTMLLLIQPYIIANIPES